MRFIVLFLLGALLVACEQATNRALVKEYHQSVVNYYEGKSPDTVPYTLELEQALQDLARKGEIIFRRVEFDDIPYSSGSVQEGIAAIQKYYSYIIDATFPVVPDGESLAVELYYYPQHYDKVEEAVNAIGSTGQPSRVSNGEHSAPR